MMERCPTVAIVKDVAIPDHDAGRHSVRNDTSAVSSGGPEGRSDLSDGTGRLLCDL